MNRIAVAFTGTSMSGKTTLIQNITEVLKKQGKKVAIIKNDPQDKAVFDTKGKDSYKFSQTGSQVIVVSPSKTTFLKQTTSSLDEMIRLFDDFNYLFVEGLKTLPLPKICVIREKINEDYFSISDALAVHKDIDSTKLNNITILDLDNYDQIISWINKNGLEV